MEWNQGRSIVLEKKCLEVRFKGVQLGECLEVRAKGVQTGGMS